MKVVMIGGQGNYSATQKLKQVLQNLKAESMSAQVHQYDLSEVSSLSEVQELWGGLSMFNQAAIVILHNPISQSSAKIKTELADFLKSQTGDVKLVLYEHGSIDKRSTIYKFCKDKGDLYDFPIENDYDKKGFCEEFIKKAGWQVSAEVRQRLLEYLIPKDLFSISNELVKLTLLLDFDDRKELQLSDLELIPLSVESEVWELFNLAVFDKAKALVLLDDLFLQQVHFSLIIGFLASQLRQLLNYYYNSQSLKPFFKTKLAKLAPKMPAAKLNMALLKLADLDCALKSTKLDPKLGLTMYLAIL